MKSNTYQPLKLQAEQKPHPFGLGFIMELFDIGPTVAVAAFLLTLTVLMIAVYFFIHSAPPNHLTIATGPEGSVFQKNALKYAKILQRDGVRLELIPSDGSLDNIRKLSDPKGPVDIGFVQAGVEDEIPANVFSLGSISYQPLMLFYRGKDRELLSEFKGYKIAVGPAGSGSHKFATELLAANQIVPGGPTEILTWETDDAVEALLSKKIEAAFVMSEGASIEILHKLLHSDEVRLFNFKQANAYSRKIQHLNLLEIPEGLVDFGKNLPPHDVTLLGPMIELVANKNLHPALSDLLLQAAVEIHGKPGTYQHRGDFPKPIEHLIPISPDANRFYSSGKSFIYRYMPFWLASLTSRVLVVFLPTLVLLIPILKSIPALFRWRIQAKIRRRYRELLELEKEFFTEKDTAKLADLREDFDLIENAVNRMRVAPRFADQYYGLRGHIDYVRGIFEKKLA